MLRELFGLGFVTTLKCLVRCVHQLVTLITKLVRLLAESGALRPSIIRITLSHCKEIE